jgi:uncharacterized protein
MHIWVDADACPKVIKEIIFRAAARTKTHTTLVANQRLVIPPSEYIAMLKVAHGFDVADDEIIAKVEPCDLVITGDIPLAHLAIKKGCLALNPRGKLYTDDNIQERLATRNLMEQLRDVGMATGGPSALGSKEKQDFANHLDRIITQAKRAS